MKLRKVTVVLLLLALCLSLASCGSNDGLSIACVGYVKGEAGSVQNEKNGEERYILPAEFVRSFAVYTASEKGALSLETGAQVLYSYDKIYMKTLVESASGEPQAFLSKMNEVATLAGTSLRFGSMTGLRNSEEELFEYMGKGCAFTESTGTLEDLKKAAELFLENGILCRLLSAYEWEIGSKFVSRSAPLLQPKSKWYLENCRLYLSGQAIRGTKNAFIALAAVEEEGRVSFAVVAEQSGEDDPTNFAAVDAGNLCGSVFGIDYGFSFSSTELSGGGGITVGATIFKITILVLVVVLAGLLVLLIIVGTMERFKRNRAARIKYAPPKEKPGREESVGSEKDTGEEEKNAEEKDSRE